MSTFDGIVPEFPFIQIDYFRKSPDRPPPLACFLSHVHSDHLQGLESFRAPFIYCSAATREMLLQIEKYPHRMNFSKGILESRRLHYKHLSKLLRPVPLNTPTEIELTPLLSIRVTLFDANHCAGAVMFLLEGDGNAILYTGDIRAETWWVNSLVRHPVLIPYTLGGKRLDKIYLDTTFARANHVCQSFSSKAEGLNELLQMVERYPQDTIFYFRAWTFGYEDVWVALSTLLKSKIHVDRYQIGLYRALGSNSRAGIAEVSALCGFEFGNRFVAGCLSEDEDARVHSCEPGVQCSACRSRNTVYIIPIVGRTRDGTRVPELGAGGGGGDLYQTHELELPDQSALQQLEDLCLEKIPDPTALSQTREVLAQAFNSKTKALSLDSYGMKDVAEMPLEELVQILSRGRPNKRLWPTDPEASASTLRDTSGNPLPKVIYFPYSRHSSYEELCTLVSAFKPKDVHPCTVDPHAWTEETSIRTLFGHLCSGNGFAHDQHMRDTLAVAAAADHDSNHNPPYPQKRARYDDDNISTQSSSMSLPTSIPTPILDSIDSTSPRQTKNHNPVPELPIPRSTAETQKSKRNEIRRAWNLLHAHTLDPDASPHIRLGPLPSSWPTAEEDSFDLQHTESDPGRDSRLKPNSSNGLGSSRVAESPKFGPKVETPTDVDVESEFNYHQSTSQISLPSSAFASQELDLELEHLHGQEQQQQQHEQQVTDLPPLHKSSSSFARRAAYLAARADSYEAWALEGLLSVEGGHGVEEMEL